MPHIAMGVDENITRRLMKDLSIRSERQDELLQFLKETIEREESNEIDNLQTFIAHTTKANELCFLCFMQGIFTGGYSVSAQVNRRLPEIVEKSARFGAAEAMKGNLPPDMATATSDTADQTTTEAKKKKSEDIMYG